jgi:hypothetical protein
MRVRAHPHFLGVALPAICAGVLTGLAAAGHAGPFAGLAVATRPLAAAHSLPPLNAALLYPPATPPPPTESLVVVPYPPPPVPTTAIPAPASATAIASVPPSTPLATPTPRRTPCADDDCGGGD